MYLHEYQAKSILRGYGVPVPQSGVASTASDALRVAKHLGGNKWVVKAQIHAGGRGKGGGVKIANAYEEVYDLSLNMLGMTLVTHQTGPEGKVVRRIMVEQATSIDKEFYLSFMVDRDSESNICVASSEGGMDIEEVARTNPSAIVTETVRPYVGMQQFQGRKMAKKLGLTGSLVNKFAMVIEKLYRAFRENDLMLLEINPLVITTSGDIVCLDCKMTIDDNALFRHPELEEMKDYGEMDPNEVRASLYDLSYVSLEGNIGCMVNGAGLAMGTMDIIKYYGGEPANFLDVGGGADTDKVREAFRIILADKNVKVILVNIFGGILRCDVIAQGILQAARDIQIDRPVVVRLEGTNVDEGKRILAESDLNVIGESSLAEAAKRAVELAGGVA